MSAPPRIVIDGDAAPGMTVAIGLALSAAAAALAKHGPRSVYAEHPGGDDRRCRILTEEVGEVAEAIEAIEDIAAHPCGVTRDDLEAELDAELAQVAATALLWLARRRAP